MRSLRRSFASEGPKNGALSSSPWRKQHSRISCSISVVGDFGDDYCVILREL